MKCALGHPRAVIRDGEAGATAVEYAIMVSLIAIVIIAAVVLVGQNLNEQFECVASAVGSLPGIDECAG